MKLYNIFSGLVESAASEKQGLSILGGVDNAESIIKNFAEKDKSNNQKNVPAMAYFYASGYKDIDNIISYLNAYNELEVNKQVKPIQITGSGIKIGDKVFSDFLKFTEFIDGEKTFGGGGSSSVAKDFKAEKKPIWSGNNIDIYDGDDVGKCISYTQGSLTGRAYSFCIGQPGNTMYKSYRDTKDSSFYFIIDRNKFKTNEDGSVNLDDPLHIVVFDVTKYGVELTDGDNTTGNISEYGEDVDGYISYLRGKGVPVDKLVNRPKTDKEEEEERLLGRKNDSLEWFMKLPAEYKSAYIGRGHVLTNDQFDYLIGA